MVQYKRNYSRKGVDSVTQKDTTKAEKLTLLIQGVGGAENTSDQEVLQSYSEVGSAGATIQKWVSTAVSFVLPFAEPKKK